MFAFLKKYFGQEKTPGKNKIIFSVDRSVRTPTRFEQPFRVLFTAPYSSNREFEHFLVGMTQDRKIFGAFGNAGSYEHLLISKEEVKFGTMVPTDITVQQVGDQLCIYVFGKLVAKGSKKSTYLGYQDIHFTMDIRHPAQHAIFGSSVLMVKRRTRGLPVHVFSDPSFG